MKKIDKVLSDFSSLPLERRWHEQVYPAPIVVALIRRQLRQRDRAEIESYYLLIKRKSRPYDGHWALVGGKWDFGETLPEAIIREVKEETDLATTFVAVRGLVSERVLPTRQEQKGAHFLLFVCELAAGNGQAKEQNEGKVGWFTCAQIDALHESGTIIPSDYAMIHSFAGASGTVSHVEAAMRTPIGGASEDPTQLIRFEHIEGSDFKID